MGRLLLPRAHTLSMFFERLLLFVLVTVPLCTAAAVSTPDPGRGIVTLHAYVGTDRVRTGTGFVVQTRGRDAYVMTSATLLAGEPTITAVTPAGDEQAAKVLRLDAPIDFALLRVDNTDAEQLVFSLAAPAPGDPIWAVTLSAGAPVLARGLLVNAYTMPGQSVGILSHSASVSSDSLGSILVNECNEVVGINLGFGTSDGNTRALDGSAIRTLLAREGVTVSESDRPCVSAMDQARQQAQAATEAARLASERATRAQQVARDLEQRLTASSEANIVEARAREARERADAALQAAARAQDEAEATRQEMAEQTATIKAETEAVMRYLERDRQAAEARFREALAEQGRVADATRNQLWLALLVIVILVVLFAVLVFRRPAPVQADTPPLEESPAVPPVVGATVPHNEQLAEYVLDGRDEDGIRYLLRISGDQLINPEGIVIGRNPQDSPFAINHVDVSRKHARMKVMKNRVFLEDLGSTNGTSVNGQSIDDKGPVAVNNGDQIIIGSVVMKLRVLGA
ncbi:MAG: FHA domain-containing protein [Pseudomonadota bacterium]